MISGIFWNAGKRQVNQDSISYQQIRGKQGSIGLALVADGIGGLSEGEIASGYLAEEVTTWFYQEVAPRKLMEEELLMLAINAKLNNISEALQDYGRQKGISLGTTCTAVFFCDRRYLLMHIGDCKAYYLRKNSVKLLTEEHVTEDGKLNRCIGSMGSYETDFYSGKVGKESAILLCSDGFWKDGEGHFRKMLLPGEMQSQEQIERKLQMIGEDNLRKGTSDNQSAIYIKW